jgi:endonuclease-3 related protein
VGPETADAILLYAGGRPSFVVDAYTRRIMGRYGAVDPGARLPYDAVRSAWHHALAPPGQHPDRSARRFSHVHAAIVELAKSHCRPVPRCPTCPLSSSCARTGIRLGPAP